MSTDPSLRGYLDETLRQAFARMEGRIRAGDSWDAETFLAAHADLASDAERVVDLLLHEYFVRRQLGQPLDPHEWFGRFPRWKELLERRLQNLQTVDGEPEPPADARTLDHVQKSAAISNEAVPELGRHEVYEEIGRGAMGVVYRAKDLILNRPVALKMIVVRHGLLETPQAVQRFYREARAAARLRHPNIIPIHGMGLHQGRHCFTMPLLTGGSLVGRIAEFRGDARAAVALVEKIARAVQSAHSQGVIHRDLKPANILLDENREPHVADFGLAKVLDDEVDASLPGQRVGTPAYMSPEQAAGHTWKVTAASDVWSLGVILYELLTGRRPFTGDTTEGVFEHVLTKEPPSARALQPDLASDLEAVLEKCLRKDLDQRYPSAAAFADDLARWLRNERIAREPVQRPRRTGRWTPALLAVGGLALLLSLGALALFLGNRSEGLPPKIAPISGHEVTDRPEDADALLREYASGRPVPLVGLTGPPRWYRWQTENQGFGSPYPPNKGLRLEGFEIVLMQLMPPDPLRRGFRLEAEVWHEQSNKGWAGLYCDCEERQHGGREALFSALVFADQGANADQVRLRRQLYRRADQERAWSKLNLTSTPILRALPPPKPQTAPWRKLVIEAAETIRVSWDGQPPQEIPATTLVDQTTRFLAQDLLAPDAPPPHPFNPGGGLGLYVESGSAWFRNVVVQQLREP